jgi:hypothetical protein
VSGRKFLAGIALGLVAGIALDVAARSWFAASNSYDSVDRFKVLAVVPEPGTSRSAVIVNYENGNSSAGGTALWVIDTPAPPIGSEEPLKGRPDLVSTVPFSADQLSWRSNHRILLKVKAPANLSADDHYCFWDTPPLPTICLAGNGVDVEVAP